MTYEEKLKDKRWRSKRIKILRRDNFKCRSCGKKDTELHVHHLIYEKDKDPWDYSNNKLITLCKDCHKTVEKCIKEITILSRIMSSNKDKMIILLNIIKEHFQDTDENMILLLDALDGINYFKE